jgi:hypothetical protein
VSADWECLSHAFNIYGHSQVLPKRSLSEVGLSRKVQYFHSLLLILMMESSVGIHILLKQNKNSCHSMETVSEFQAGMVWSEGQDANECHQTGTNHSGALTASPFSHQKSPTPESL